jgi:RsiW-degrading membrane proteinase PrsW (M82 family)
MHWLLLLALFPLALSLLQPDVAKEDLLTRLRETFDKATPEEQARILLVMEKIHNHQETGESLFDALPEEKLAGALLARNTWVHWGFAAVAAFLFMAFFLLLASHGTAEPQHLLSVGLFTSTVGIVLLLVLQWVADWSQGVWLTGGNIVVVLFYVVKLIGFSYRAAHDPQNGFFLSFLGYTLGVGFCEEVVKALPLLWTYRRPCEQSWRGAFVWGLTSGAGFGIAEGVMYSSRWYNGISGSESYLVRFISCVALHALWTGSVAITLHRRQALIQNAQSWYDYIVPLFLIVGVPMLLHGLYDTLLKKEMNALALVPALLSFLFLAYQITRQHRDDAKSVVDSVSARW